MSHQILHHRFDLDVDASGDFTETTTRSYNGYIVKVEYADGDLADGTDLTITALGDSLASIPILADGAADDDTVYYPVQVSHDRATGAELATAANIWQRIHISGTITCVVANGGVSTSGTAVVWIEV